MDECILSAGCWCGPHNFVVTCEAEQPMQVIRPSIRYYKGHGTSLRVVAALRTKKLILPTDTLTTYMYSTQNEALVSCSHVSIHKGCLCLHLVPVLTQQVEYICIRWWSNGFLPLAGADVSNAKSSPLFSYILQRTGFGET